MSVQTFSVDEIVFETMSCGAHLVVQPMTGVHTCALSCVLPFGYAHEPTIHEGLSVIWSEMLMRGDADLDARAQADAFDRIGASRSADAGSRVYRIGLSCLGDRLDDALGLIAGMIRRPRFGSDALEPSRQLALQSLASVADDPQQRAAYAARDRHHPAPLNRTGLGTPEGLAAITLDDVRDGWAKNACPQGAIFGIAGNVDPARVRDRFETLFGDWTGSAPDLVLASDPVRGYGHLDDDSTQTQIIVVQDGPAERDPNSVLERIAIAVLSGGMSGRLFTEVREKRGLCYAVQASYRADVDRGAVTGYVGTTPERAQESLDVLLAEMDRITTPAGKVTRDEFDRAIIGLTSNVVFGGESTSARAGALASDVYRLGRPRTLDEVKSEIKAVTLDQLNVYVAQRTPGVRTIQTLGPKALTPPA